MTLNPARGFWVMMNCELLYRGVVWFVAFWWKNDWNEINPPIIWRECSVVLHVREERARARCQMWITPLGTSPDCSIKRNLLKTTQAERFLPPSEMTLFVYPWHLKSRTLRRSRSGQHLPIDFEDIIFFCEANMSNFMRWNTQTSIFCIAPSTLYLSSAALDCLSKHLHQPLPGSLTLFYIKFLCVIIKILNIKRMTL